MAKSAGETATCAVVEATCGIVTATCAVRKAGGGIERASSVRPRAPNEFANEPVRGWTGSIDGEVVILGAGDTVLLRGCEQNSTGTFADGPITTLPAAATSANPSVTVTTASLVEVVARVILSSGSQFDSTAGGVTANHAYGT